MNVIGLIFFIIGLLIIVGLGGFLVFLIIITHNEYKKNDISAKPNKKNKINRQNNDTVIDAEIVK